MNKQSQNRIDKTVWSSISPDSNFTKWFFSHPSQIRSLRHANQIHVAIMPLTPVVDPEGNVFNPATAVIFFNN